MSALALECYTAPFAIVVIPNVHRDPAHALARVRRGPEAPKTALAAPGDPARTPSATCRDRASGAPIPEARERLVRTYESRWQEVADHQLKEAGSFFGGARIPSGVCVPEERSPANAASYSSARLCTL